MTDAGKQIEDIVPSPCINHNNSTTCSSNTQNNLPEKKKIETTGTRRGFLSTVAEVVLLCWYLKINFLMLGG
jgi:hypothetical protein